MARSGTKFPEGMQFRRPRLPEEAVPGVASEPDDARQSSLKIAKFHRAHQRGEVSTKRAQYSPIPRAWIELRDQKDRGPSERCGYCLCKGRRSSWRFGCAYWIVLHVVSCLRLLLE